MQRSIVFLIMFLNVIILMSENRNLMFYSLTMRDGLSNNEVNTVFKDSKGFIWVGTKSGLNKYDGYKFTVYKNENENISSISGDNVFTITEDLSGNLWIGTNAGINKFKRETEQFERFDLEDLRAMPSFNNRTHFLFIDSNGILWIGYENGLEILDTKSNKRLVSKESIRLKKMFKGMTVSYIFQDKNNNMWIGSWFGGLTKIDQTFKTHTQYTHQPNNPKSIPNNIISAIYEDDNKTLWVSTFGGGLCYYNDSSDSFTTIKSPLVNREISAINSFDKNRIWVSQGHSVAELNINSKLVEHVFAFDPTNPLSFTESTINNLYKDNTGIIWISTNMGISFYDPNRDRFSSKFNPFLDGNKNINYAKTFLFDKQNNAFIGTFGNGFYFYNNEEGSFTRIALTNETTASKVVSSIVRLQNNEIWVATSNGIYVIDEKTKKTIRHIVATYPKSSNGLYHNNIQKIFQDTRGWIWIATQESLDVIINQNFHHFTKSNLNGLSNYKVTDLIEDKHGNIWIGTFHGLNKFNWETKTITKYFARRNFKSGLLSSDILCLFNDSKGNIFVGTSKGLSIYNEKENQFKVFDLGTGSENEIVYKINEDKDGDLWLICSSGVLKLDRKNNRTKRYDHNDGLNYNYETLAVDNRGYLYIGGKTNGFYKFDYKKIIENTLAPPVYITNLLLFNKEVKIEPNKRKSVLQNSILYTDEITLKHDQTVIGFEFAALNYTLPMKNKYAYKLHGFDKEWNYVDANKRFVTYTNLMPGNYTLFVRASNNDGVWNDNEARINIHVLPPFWRTNIAYFSYFLIIVGLLYLYRHFMIMRYREKTNIALERIESEKKHEVDQMKLRFFTNISHEFRTPLTLISGPLTKLIADAKQAGNEKLLNQYLLMQRNTQRLLMLINQLLDLRKSETGNLSLNLNYGDIIAFMYSLYGRFNTVADQNQIEYRFDTAIEKLETKFDADKIEKIVFNLLSNAFKFTNTKIVFKIWVENNSIIFEVMDDGVGLAIKDINKIFDHFYQVDDSTARKVSGSGVGLALTRELVLLHKGNINVKSEIGKGASFIVTLPLSDKIDFNDNEIESSNQTNDLEGNMATQNLFVTDSLQNKTLDTEKALVLIVEDNIDLRHYISETLDKKYRIIEAGNGKEGFEKATDIMPDLIISDVMMPELDGVELCTLLKSDVRTSHIPVILLTALNSNESRLLGVKRGADDYIVKPFNESLLLARIENLIENRKVLQLKFQKTLYIDTNELSTNTPDEKLLKKAIELIEANIDNLDFNIQQLVTELNVSRRGVYAKIKAMTGLSVSDFIKSIRLRRAAQLMLSKEYTISEIYYMVGFQNRTHFNDSFKKQFEMTPSEFIKTHAVK